MLDSIAGVYRDCKRTRKALTERATQFFALATAMKALSARHRGVPFVVVNQVTADFDRPGGVKPALGPAWTACITHRVMVRAKGLLAGGEEAAAAAASAAAATTIRRFVRVRELMVLLSSSMPTGRPADFTLRPEGARSVRSASPVGVEEEDCDLPVFGGAPG